MFKNGLEHCSRKCISVNIVHGNAEVSNGRHNPCAATYPGRDSELAARFWSVGARNPLKACEQCGGLVWVLAICGAFAPRARGRQRRARQSTTQNHECHIAPSSI